MNVLPPMAWAKSELLEAFYRRAIKAEFYHVRPWHLLYHSVLGASLMATSAGELSNFKTAWGACGWRLEGPGGAFKAMGIQKVPIAPLVVPMAPLWCPWHQRAELGHISLFITELGLPCRGFTPPFRGQG